MRARQLIADAAYGPDTLKVLFKAFDGAWDAIAPSISGRAGAIEAARMKLANIVLSLSNDSKDPEQIKNAAIRLTTLDD